MGMEYMTNYYTALWKEKKMQSDWIICVLTDEKRQSWKTHFCFNLPYTDINRNQKFLE